MGVVNPPLVNYLQVDILIFSILLLKYFSHNDLTLSGVASLVIAKPGFDLPYEWSLE